MLNEPTRRLLTEKVLGECWHTLVNYLDSGVVICSCGQRFRCPDEGTFHVEQENDRTFTTPQDAQDVKDALVRAGKWDKFYAFVTGKFMIFSCGQGCHCEMMDWLWSYVYNSAGNITGYRLCELAGEFVKEGRMKEYIQTEKECSERCVGKVCLRCGFALSPIETVDNSDRPTFWAGCTNCMIFSPGTRPEIFTIAKEIQRDHQDISMDDLCSITARILYTHEADKKELSLANKALGKKCTELEAARDYNAGLCDLAGEFIQKGEGE